MTRFYGQVGYYVGDVEVSPGVYDEGIEERSYYGDITRISRRLDVPDSMNGDVTPNHRISVVADGYAFSNFFNIRYVVWRGAKWLVTVVELERPRLILTIGPKYNGPEKS